MMTTETLDKIYLELSQFTKAKTKREATLTTALQTMQLASIAAIATLERKDGAVYDFMCSIRRHCDQALEVNTPRQELE
jgi:hypothetical protein